jgi:hypothetical protein
MPSILYGGVEYVLIRHAVFCKLCNDTVESVSVHDFKMCSCGSVGVDGGTLAGNTVLGKPENMESRSVYCATVGGKKVYLPQDALPPARGT